MIHYPFNSRQLGLAGATFQIAATSLMRPSYTACPKDDRINESSLYTLNSALEVH